MLPVMNPDRALTRKQKAEIMSRLLAAWLKQPEMRLGQLMENARKMLPAAPELFQWEDFDVARKVEAFAFSTVMVHFFGCPACSYKEAGRQAVAPTCPVPGCRYKGRPLAALYEWKAPSK